MELDDYKLKIFEKYIEDAGSNYESFLKEHDLENETDIAKINKVKITLIDEGIAIMGQEDFFKNYLSKSDFNEFKAKRF